MRATTGLYGDEVEVWPHAESHTRMTALRNSRSSNSNINSPFAMDHLGIVVGLRHVEDLHPVEDLRPVEDIHRTPMDSSLKMLLLRRIIFLVVMLGSSPEAEAARKSIGEVSPLRT